MQRTIIKKLNNNVQKLGKTLNIFTYLESLKILMLRIEAGGHLALECLWILDSFRVFIREYPLPRDVMAAAAAAKNPCSV